MKTVGIVDLGSNSARLVVYAFEPGRWHRMIDEIREPVRLGEGMVATGRLSPAAIQRAIATLSLYSDYAEATALDSLEVVATSAVRDASNRDELLHVVEGMGHRVTVLSGAEEAAVGVLAVANSTALEDAWVIDLGGGSAQISKMVGRRAVFTESFPLGNVRLTDQFFQNDPPSAAEIAALELEVERQLGPIVDEIRADGLPLVAMGGTIRNLATAVQKTTDYPLDLVHEYVLDAGALRRLVGKLLAVNAAQRALVRGIHPDRADVIAAGALVYRWLLRATDRLELRVAGQGIREGIFYRHSLPSPHLLPDVRRFTIENLSHRYPQPPDHVRGVSRLAARLFDQLAPLHGYGTAERELLQAAAALHDIGATVNYYDHHRHGAYLVTASPLGGFDHREQAMIALLVRYHRKGIPKGREFRDLLGGGDKGRLRVLAACLRLAECFERSRAGRVRDVEVTIGGDEVAVAVLAEETPQVEIWEGRKQAELFERAFGRRLRLEAHVAVAPG